MPTPAAIRTLRLLIALVILLPAAAPVAAQEPANQAGFVRWRANEDGFAAWERDGARVTANGALVLDRATAYPQRDPYAPGGFHGRYYYNGGGFLVGEALSPITPTDFAFTEAVVSWNADTPPGTWIEARLRARLGERWTAWYNLGVWASDTSVVQRHSLEAQSDGDASVDVDTLVLNDGVAPADALQVKVRMFSVEGTRAVPSVRNVFVAYSDYPDTPNAAPPGDPRLWGRTLPVHACSQMVYPDGGEVWCSPTSTAMVLTYWLHGGDACEPRVRSAAAGVYDWLYDGHGNWPFNTAYAATQEWSSAIPKHGGRAWARTPVRRVRGQQLEAYVARFTSLAQAEEWIAAGVSVIVSVAWGTNALSGAPFPASSGHLALLVGFDEFGNPIVNDPGAPGDAAVRRTYLRGEFEPLWLGHTDGTVYLIHPPGWPVPNL
jgi:hypothetical protein